LLKTDILGVFAHPDDETGMAATLASYALGRHSRIAHVYCTRGEGGGNMVGTHLGPALGVLRETELRDCLAELGIHRCHFLDKADFAYTESLSITLEKWGNEETLGRLVRLVRALRPEVIVTMNPAPTPGQHGNHQAAGVFAIEAFDLAADPTWFPEQITQEGLHPWQPRKLYFGGAAGTGATIVVDQSLPGGRTPASVAAAALAHHRSQGFGNFAGATWLRRPQSFTLVKSVIPFATQETDLLQGLPVAGDLPARILASGDAPVFDGLMLEFVPRPSLERYQAWVHAERIEHVASRLVTDIPVVAGERNDIFLYTRNSTSTGESALIRFATSPGWEANFSDVTMRFSPNRTNRMRILVRPPAGQPADGEVVATTQLNGRETRIAARLHPVPKLGIPRVASGLPLSTNDTEFAWAALPSHEIPSTNTWQGTVASAADLGARFRIAHDATTVYVEVRVTDDIVVSNIAPDDIKGHWRSDSVELCFDPVAGAEHTLGCYKLGIFPFDSTGRVRAARDADANAGPIESTAPGTRLASWRTPEGYAIRAAIPLSEIGFKPAPNNGRIGFNVLVYDGDKRDAAPGENINKSRIAWAPRPGVQGRPEDWGRADFE
jgi:LmbE family N-acetylglucosaminyl deacetylase